tara:strand:- start:255 stop:479 length:225 start_codon:yes stop_codon:yes gene_type:complete
MIYYSKEAALDFDIDGEAVAIVSDTEEYNLSEFMRPDSDSEYHGIMGLTNTSALALKFNDEDGYNDSVTLYWIG